MGYVGQAPLATSITSSDIADDAVNSDQIAAGAVDAAHMSANSIDSDSYVDGSIDNAHLADDAVDSDEIAAGAIDNAHLADDAVDSDELAAGAVDEAHIADNQVTLAKMAGIARGKLIYGDASGNPAVLASGDAGEILTMTDGNDFDWAAAAAGGSTTDFEADGAITNGSFVALTSLGKIKAMVSEVLVDGVSFDTHGSPLAAVYDVTNDRLFIAYSDGDDSGKGKCVIGNVSGGAITFGTPVEFEGGSTAYITVCHDLSVDRFIIVYADAGDSYKGKYVVVTVDGSDAITVATPAEYHSGNYVLYPVVRYDPDEERIVLFFKGNAAWPSDGFGMARAGTVTGASTNTIAWGTAEVFSSARGTFPKGASYDTTTDRFVLTYSPTLTAAGVWATVVEVDGSDNSFDFGSTLQVDSGTISQAIPVFDPSTGKTVIVWEGSTSHGEAALFTVTGGGTNSITKDGSNTVWHAYDVGNEGTWAVYDENLSKVVITYSASSSSPGEVRGEYVKCTIVGTDVTYSDPFVFAPSTLHYWSAPVFDPDSNRILVPHYGLDGDGRCTVINTTIESNYLDWIGIAAASVSDGEDCAVNLIGSVNESQTSLTVGATYYVNDYALLTATNPLSATAAGSREVGRAVAADKILITKGSIS
jgi:hypothetical protein